MVLEAKRSSAMRVIASAAARARASRLSSPDVDEIVFLGREIRMKQLLGNVRAAFEPCATKFSQLVTHW